MNPLLPVSVAVCEAPPVRFDSFRQGGSTDFTPVSLNDCHPPGEEFAQLRSLLQQLGGQAASPVPRGRNIASWHACGRPIHSRRWHRMAWNVPLLLTPLDEETRAAVGEAVEVLGKDLSLGGASILHPQPLACRIASLRLLGDDVDGPQCLLRLSWCRFRKNRLYQSGGAFLRR